MSELTNSGAPRRRRADAQRSVAAILDAAARVLGRDPRASVEDVATAAGLTRQTVYAHFSSRDALIDALTDRVTDRVFAALDAADLDRMPAGEALVRLVQISWQEFEAAAFLLTLPPSAGQSQREDERHRPVFERLERIVERGRRDGDFDPDLPAAWIVAATVALGHAAGEQVRAGNMTTTAAAATLKRALPRLFTAW